MGLDVVLKYGRWFVFWDVNLVQFKGNINATQG